MILKTIIFDCGNVFLSDSGNNDAICEDIADSCNLPYDVAKKAALGLLPRYQAGSLDDKTYWDEFQRLTKCTLPENPEQLWLRKYFPNSHPDYKVIFLAKTLQQNGYRTPVISNTIPPHVRANRARNIFQFFQPEIFSCEVGLRKPDERIYLLAFKKTGSKPEECVFIDDVLEYVIAARKVGIHGIHYKNVHQLTKELQELGVKVVS